MTLPDGRIWRNLVTEEKSKVAETLAEFRGNFRYNLLDDNLRRFNAQVPQIIQWDDHEVRNNWYPGEILADSDARYTEKSVDVLAARARRAFSEYFPISTLRPGARRGPRAPGGAPRPAAGRVRARHAHVPQRQLARRPARTDPQGILGAEQLEWLKRELSRSRAVWKVIAADMPLGLVVPDGTEGRPNIEAVAQGDPGAPLGRELEIAELLRYVKHRRITGTVWLTADVHYTAAHHYEPVAGRVHRLRRRSGSSSPARSTRAPSRPNALDGTFGPERVFVKAPTAANVSPRRATSSSARSTSTATAAS